MVVDLAVEDDAAPGMGGVGHRLSPALAVENRQPGVSQTGPRARRSSSMFVVLFILLILLALFGMPLFAVLGSIALAAFYGAGIDISSVAVSMYTLAGSPLLVAIPLFTFAGYLFAHSGTPGRLVRLSRSLFPGGLAIVALVIAVAPNVPGFLHAAGALALLQVLLRQTGP